MRLTVLTSLAACAVCKRAEEQKSLQPFVHLHDQLYVQSHQGTEFCCAQLQRRSPKETSHNKPKFASLRYVQIFKTDTQGICAQLATGGAIRGGCNTTEGDDDTFTFSFVREPLEHFISGYSEVVLRAMYAEQAGAYSKCAAQGCYSFLEKGLSETERARRFVDDFIAGKVHSPCCNYTRVHGDLHVVPQLAFLMSAMQGRLSQPVSRLDFVGKLEQLHVDWQTIGGHVPGFQAEYKQSNNKHTSTDAESGNEWREAMEALLLDDTGLGPAKRDAFCSILRYDYSCFGYKPARVCAGASAEAMRAECPLVELQGKLVAPNGYTDVNPLNGRTDA